MADALEALAGVVAADVLLDAVEASRKLAELGIPHALIGGLAVGVLGHPRATRDVDYLVGREAFERTGPVLVFREELRDLARVGVVDFMPLSESHTALLPFLRLPAGTEIPVIPPEGLVLLKLEANRPQDRADVAALVETGAGMASITAFLRRHAPQLVARFAEIVSDT